jgi:ribosomal protein S18 acetylase RimI-like enzyme
VSARGDAEVRPARQEDWPVVQRLLGEADGLHAELAPSYFRVAPRAEGEWRRLLGDSTAVALVAVDADAPGSPRGFLALRVYDTPEDPTMVPRRRAHIETLIVAAGHRRRGIGRRLVAAAAARARAAGAVEMVLTAWAGNAAADAFYERLGYRVLSRVLHLPI